MTTEAKLSELIPLKVTKTMADELAIMAGGPRKRANYIRGLIEKDIEQKLSQTEEGRFCAKLVVAMKADPALKEQVESLLPKSMRRRMSK